MLLQLLQYSISEKRLSFEQKYRLPDQVVYSGERDTQYTGKSKSVFIGEKSYQSKLSQEVTAEGKRVLFPLIVPYLFFPNEKLHNYNNLKCTHVGITDIPAVNVNKQYKQSCIIQSAHIHSFYIK